jgi:hypothetical protein
MGVSMGAKDMRESMQQCWSMRQPRRPPDRQEITFRMTIAAILVMSLWEYWMRTYPRYKLELEPRFRRHESQRILPVRPVVHTDHQDILKA